MFWSINNLFDKHKLEPTELEPTKFDCIWYYITSQLVMGRQSAIIDYVGPMTKSWRSPTYGLKIRLIRYLQKKIYRPMYLFLINKWQGIHSNAVGGYDSIIYNVYPGIFISMGMRRKDMPVLENSDSPLVFSIKSSLWRMLFLSTYFKYQKTFNHFVWDVCSPRKTQNCQRLKSNILS
jgi:hypothetical protein